MDSRDADSNKIYDRSPRDNHGDLYNVSQGLDGIVNESFGFDGSNIDPNLQIQQDDKSVAAWIKLGQLDDFRFIWNIASSASDGLGLAVDQDVISLYDDTAGNDIRKINTTISSTEWTHIVVLLDSGNLVLYVNGEKSGKANQSAIKTAPFSIGSRFAGDTSDGPFNGNIDDLRLYDRVISESEIKAIYQQRNVRELTSDGFPVASDNLIAYYPFKDGTARDDARNANYGDPTAYNGTVNGATYLPDSGLRNKGSYLFNGTSHWIDLGTQFSTPSNSYTLSCWVYLNNNADGNLDASIYLKEDGAAILRADGDGTYTHYIRDNNGVQSVSGSINVDQWEHVAGVWNGSEIELYINGVLQGTSSTVGIDTSLTGGQAIGRRPDDTLQYMDGEIDDARVYNKALSQSEVNQIYQNTRP